MVACVAGELGPVTVISIGPAGRSGASGASTCQTPGALSPTTGEPDTLSMTHPAGRLTVTEA